MSDAGPVSSTRESPHREALRRTILVLLVVGALGLFFLAGRLAESGDQESVTVSGGTVDRLIPGDQDEVLRQNPIGIDLAPGWGLQSLTVTKGSTSYEIPEDQWDVTSELGLYQFVPGDSKVLETLPADQVCARAVVFELVDPTNTRVLPEWCFTVA